MEKLRTGAVGVSGDFALSGDDSRGPSGRVADWNGCMVRSVHIWKEEINVNRSNVKNGNIGILRK